MRAPISPFQNSDMMASGPPSPEELKLLEPFRGQVPDEVFGEPYRAAGVGRLGPGPHAAAQGRRNCCNDAGCVIKDGKRLLPNGEAVQDRIPARRAVVPAASRALHQESRHARDRRQHPAGRSPCSTARAWKISTSTSRSSASSMSATPGRQPAAVFLVAGGGHQGLLQSRRHRRSGDRCADRKGHRRRNPRRPDHCLPRSRPGVSRRALLGAAMVPRDASARLLGRVRPSGRSRRNTRRASARRKIWWYDAAKAAKPEQAK